MTNREKFIETFGYIPGRKDFFPCPDKCPEEFEDVDFCKGCPYRYFDDAEYKEPITETSMHHLSCAMCDNAKCVRGTKECEFEKWKKKEESEEEK